MSIAAPDFRQTWLFRQAFTNQRGDSTIDEQEFYRDSYLKMRERVSHLVSFIQSSMPGLTVHDLTHLDSLWDTASIVAEGAISVTPPEAFVFGASVLLHDSAMSVAAYAKGMEDICKTIEWKDAFARWQQSHEHLSNTTDAALIPDAAIKDVLPDVLRRLHAKQAAVLAEQAWTNESGEQQCLIEDSDLRAFYGKSIGDIAHSHWWSVQRIEAELGQDLGAFPQRTRHRIDKVKLACMIRLADALHLDQLRAPRFLRTLLKPAGISAKHWTFQEKLARPHVESDAVVFTTGSPFDRSDAESWWLAYDTVSSTDRELRDVDILMQSRGREGFKARRVKGSGSPEAMSKTIETRDWRPVDARIKVTDVPRIVETLGGAKLYGNDPLVPLRELIQNAADAVQARRRIQKRGSTWGEIRISLKKNDGDWLVVEDNGIGMSELILTGPLLDFGTSFWRSPLVMDEFPGLVAAGMKAIGRFGIGFFSVFMLGDTVRVTSRRYDKGTETARVLEISGGPGGRPIIWPATDDETPLDGGTRIEVLLKKSPTAQGGWLHSSRDGGRLLSLTVVVAAIAPSVDVNIHAMGEDEFESVVVAGDWLKISESKLLHRLDYHKDQPKVSAAKLLRTLVNDDGSVVGRATISPSMSWSDGEGWITVSGLRANKLRNIEGVFSGEATTAARNVATPTVQKHVLKKWATEQASLINAARISDERKAEVAETVLECGGDIGGLPIVRMGRVWINSKELVERFRDMQVAVIYFDGEVNYDEDLDEMHPREFKESFEEDEELVFVPKHDGSIVRSSGVIWPNSLFDGRAKENRIASLVLKKLDEAWAAPWEESTELRKVGSVGSIPVSRNVVVYTRLDVDSFQS